MLTGEKKVENLLASSFLSMFPTSLTHKDMESESRALSLSGATKEEARGWRPRKNRNRFGIITDILTIAQRGERKTHIMYQANMSFYELTEYLGFLIEQGLIEQHFDQEEHAVTFRTTQAGFDFMRRYEVLREMMMTTDEDKREKKEEEVALRSL